MLTLLLDILCLRYYDIEFTKLEYYNIKSVHLIVHDKETKGERKQIYLLSIYTNSHIYNKTGRKYP